MESELDKTLTNIQEITDSDEEEVEETSAVSENNKVLEEKTEDILGDSSSNKTNDSIQTNQSSESFGSAVSSPKTQENLPNTDFISGVISELSLPFLGDRPDLELPECLLSYFDTNRPGTSGRLIICWVVF